MADKAQSNNLWVKILAGLITSLLLAYAGYDSVATTNYVTKAEYNEFKCSILQQLQRIEDNQIRTGEKFDKLSEYVYKKLK